MENVEFSEEGCRPGCGGIFAYVSKDGSKIIYTRRDINPSNSVFFVNGKVEEWDYKNTVVTRKIKRKDNKLEPKNENDLPVFSPKQMECLGDLFGAERAEELTKQKPSEEESTQAAAEDSTTPEDQEQEEKKKEEETTTTQSIKPEEAPAPAPAPAAESQALETETSPAAAEAEAETTTTEEGAEAPAAQAS